MNIYIIPNKLIVALIAGFYAYAVATGMPPAQVGQHTGVALTVLVLGFFAHLSMPNFSPGVLKLMAVAFLWLGFSDGCTFVIITSVLAVVAAKVSQARGGSGHSPYLPCAAATICAMILVPGLM